MIGDIDRNKIAMPRHVSPEYRALARRIVVGREPGLISFKTLPYGHEISVDASCLESIRGLAPVLKNPLEEKGFVPAAPVHRDSDTCEVVTKTGREYTAAASRETLTAMWAFAREQK